MAPSFIKRYLIAFGKYKFWGFLVVPVAVGISGFIVMQEEPPETTYKATGRLTHNHYPTPFTRTSDQIQKQGKVTLTKEFLLDENAIKAVASQVSLSPGQIRGRLDLDLPGEDEQPPVYRLTYRDVSAERAQQIVSTLMQSMVEMSRQLNTNRLQSLINTIEQRLPAAERELQQAEAQLERFERVEGAAIVTARGGSLVGGITNSQQQQRQLKMTLEGLNAQIRSLQQRLGLTPQEAYTSSALSADPIIAQLRAQIHQIESQLNLLSKNYRPDHPQIVELKKQLDSHEQMLQRRAAEVIGGQGVAAPLISSSRIRQDSSLDPARQQLANQLVNLQTQSESLQQQLQATIETERELRQELASLPNKEIERSRLQQELARKQALYSNMRDALMDARAAEAETTSSLSIAKKPEVEAQTEEPLNPLLVLAAGTGAGIAIGAVLIFLLSALEGRYYTVEEVRNALQEREIPLLGTLPFVTSEFEPGSDKMPLAIAPDSPYLEYYERLRSNLRLSGEQKLKVILLTSAGAQEGKTFCSYNLAIASARAGKRTLLIEADLRSQSSSTSIKVACDPQGHLEPLHYYGQLNECIRLVPEVENLYLVPSPGPMRHAAAILESSEMRQLLEDARGRFDFVVIDAPSLTQCNDALMLEPYTDGMMLLARPGYTQESLLSENAEMLAESEDIEFLGAAINGAEVSVSMSSEAQPDDLPLVSDFEPGFAPPEPQADPETEVSRSHF